MNGHKECSFCRVVRLNWISKNFSFRAEKKCFFTIKWLNPLNSCNLSDSQKELLHSWCWCYASSGQRCCCTTGYAKVVWFPFFSVSIIELVPIRFHWIQTILNQSLTMLSSVGKGRKSWISIKLTGISLFVAYWFFSTFFCFFVNFSMCPKHSLHLHRTYSREPISSGIAECRWGKENWIRNENSMSFTLSFHFLRENEKKRRHRFYFFTFFKLQSFAIKAFEYNTQSQTTPRHPVGLIFLPLISLRVWVTWLHGM